MSLKGTFTDEILDIVANVKFLKTFCNEFEFFVTKRHGGKIWRLFFGANAIVMKKKLFANENICY